MRRIWAETAPLGRGIRYESAALVPLSKSRILSGGGANRANRAKCDKSADSRQSAAGECGAFGLKLLRRGVGSESKRPRESQCLNHDYRPVGGQIARIVQNVTKARIPASPRRANAAHLG